MNDELAHWYGHILYAGSLGPKLPDVCIPPKIIVLFGVVFTQMEFPTDIDKHVAQDW